jgi:peptidoglycan/xylan/chitin deacetylase (PgdA/CDA1 family)
VSDKAIKVSITSYGSGDITMTGPKATLQADKRYLFKGYYSSTTAFTLLAHYYYSDGTDRVVSLQTYPAKSDGWTTASHAFSSSHITAVQFIYKLTNPGDIAIDGVYLEPQDEIAVPEEFASSKNLIPNSSLASTTFNMPDDWTSYQSGDNTASFSYLSDSRGSYVRTAVKDFRSGEAKWQYASQPITVYGRYKFEVSYQSDKPVNVIAEYTLKDGKHFFETVDVLPPAGVWTTVQKTLEAPVGAVTLNISLVLNSDGILLRREYSLQDITKSGDLRWQRPIVSIAFDDGWRSSYTQAVPILNAYGYKGTFYINPSIIETSHFMSAANLDTLSKTGHEIAARGYSHSDMTMMSQNALNDQLNRGQSSLKAAGLQASNFAPPYGKTDPEVEWYAKKYFATLRGLRPGVNTRQNMNQYDLKAFAVKKDTDQSLLADLLDKTKQTNGWLILVYHNVNPDGSEISSTKADSSAITTKAFIDQIAQLRKSGITILPVETAYKEVSSQ